MDLRSFAQNSTNGVEGKKYQDKQVDKEYIRSVSVEEKTTAPQGEEVTEQGVRDMISQYSQMSTDQLMGELFKQITNKKAMGESSQVLSTIETIKPFLNAGQKEKLNGIITMLGLTE